MRRVGTKENVAREGKVPCRELCSLIGVVKLVFVTICGHMEAAARKACVMQLSPPAMLDVCAVVHNLLSRPDRALAGGTAQPEIDLLGQVADDIIPETPDWFLSLVGAGCLHTVGLWQRCQGKARPVRWPAAALQAGCDCLPLLCVSASRHSPWALTGADTCTARRWNRETRGCLPCVDVHWIGARGINRQGMDYTRLVVTYWFGAVPWWKSLIGAGLPVGQSVTDRIATRASPCWHAR